MCVLTCVAACARVCFVCAHREHETMSNRILDHILDSPENDIDLQVGADTSNQALHTGL
jgi:hypothetical protein